MEVSTSRTPPRATSGLLILSSGEVICGMDGVPMLAGVSQDVTGRVEAEEARRVSDDRFRLAVRATNDVVWDWNLVTNEIWVSQAMQSGLGYPTWGDWDINLRRQGIHPDDAARIAGGMQAVIERGGQSWSDEYRFRHHDGTYRDILDRSYIVRDQTGTPIRMIGAMSDVTDVKRAESELRALNARLAELVRKDELILNSTADGILGLDVDGRVTFLNPAAEQLLGWSFAEIGRWPIHDLTHRGPGGTPCDGSTCPIARSRNSGAIVSHAADTLWHKDGTCFPIEYSSMPIVSESGARLGSVCTFRDTTEIRAVERMKDEFISVVSHELRTPLTSIRGALGLLAGGLAAKSPAKGQRMLEIAVSNTDRLIRLINDILDLERIDSGKVRLQRARCSSHDLLKQAADMMRPIVEQSDVVLNVVSSSASNVWADPDRIVQTLTNLLSNAIKFSPAGGTVSMSAEDDGSEVKFRVRDAGRGIPADKLETIFERFQQVDASDSREKGGSGLGLTICRSIVRQHGSDLDVQSAVGRGSEFTFSLPSLREEAGWVNKPSNERTLIETLEHALSDSSRPRILIVENDDDVARVIDAITAEKGEKDVA